MMKPVWEVYGTIWVQNELIKEIECTDNGQSLWIRVPKSNVKAHPVARSKHDCVYLTDIYSVEWIEIQKDYRDDKWIMTLCSSDKKPIITDIAYDEYIYFTKEKDDEPIYIDKCQTSADYESITKAYDRLYSK